jgi:hypothetical protein
MARITLRTPSVLDTWGIPSLLFIGSFLVYVATLCPTVYAGDSGEFITNAVTLGINHPTGYPLYTVVSRLTVMLLSFWTPAYAANATSALFASLTVVVLFRILRILSARKGIAAITSLLFAFSHTLWSRATVVEVYTFITFFTALAILFLLRWYLLGEMNSLFLAAFIAGCGLSQHVLSALTVVSAALLIALKQPRILIRGKAALFIFGLGILGFTCYLYLPIRSTSDPPLDWGNPETLGNLLGFLFPRSVARYFSQTASQLEERLIWVLTQAFTREFWYFGGVAMLGLVGLRRDWRLLIFFLSTALITSVFALTRTLPLYADFDAYFLPLYLILAILVGVGLTWVIDVIARVVQSSSTRWFRHAVGIALAALPLITLKQNYWANDKSTNYFGFDFGANLFLPAEKNAVVFTVGDEQTFLGWYFKYVERSRADITIVSVDLLGARQRSYQTLKNELRLDIRDSDPPEVSARSILTAYMNRRPIYFTHRLVRDFVQKEYDIVHVGMLVQVLPKGSPATYRASDFALHPGWEKNYLDERCKILVDIYLNEYIDNAQFWLNRGYILAAQSELDRFSACSLPKKREGLATRYLLQALINGRFQRIGQAIACSDSAAAMNPADWRAYEYRGNFYFLAGDSLRAFSDWKKSLEINPSNQTVRRNIEAVTRLRQLRALTPPVRRR